MGILFAALFSVSCVAQAQVGSTVQFSETEPTSGISQGQFWLVPSTGALKIATSSNPLTWVTVAGGGEVGGLPAGAIVLIDSGACPAGYAEVAALNGKTILGTLNANADVGGTGGADQITPAGTNSGGAVNAHSGTAVADHASHTHTYTDVIAHTHVVTSQTATTGSATSYEHGVLDTSSAEAEATEVTGSTGVAQGTTAGPSATLAHSVTQPGNHTFTQPTFAGSQFDNRSAFVKLILCEKS